MPSDLFLGDEHLHSSAASLRISQDCLGIILDKLSKDDLDPVGYAILFETMALVLGKYVNHFIDEIYEEVKG